MPAQLHSNGRSPHGLALGTCFLRGLTIESQYGHLISSKVMRRICEGSISAWHFGQMRFRLARIASRLIFLRAGIRRRVKKAQRSQRRRAWTRELKTMRETVYSRTEGM